MRSSQAREHRDAAVRRHTERNTILVVDDDLEIRSLLKIFLEKAGYIVATAADGLEGLRFFRQYQSRIAMLLTDVRMPNMTGIDLADRVWELDSQLPVLFMSGDTRSASRGLGCLRKPFNSAELVNRVQQVVGAPGTRPEKQLES